jgi:hypothetical protein
MLAPPTIECMAKVVDSLKKLKISCPLNRYSGKYSISKRNIVENIIVRTNMVSSGLRSDQSMPSTLLL